MGKDNKKIITVFAPAKINLFLHITGKLSNGYHTLDSLVSFADIGDLITIEEAAEFSFHIKGAFAKELIHNSHSNNLVVKAAKALSQISNNPLNVRITLDKNLPLSAGIGGGSSNAAACIWGLQELWGLAHDADYTRPLMIQLGADILVCQYCKPSIMRGIGDIITPAPIMEEIPILLVNPMISCSTPDVFLHHSDAFKKEVTMPSQFEDIFDLVKYLNTLENDLFKPAIKLVPEISNVINAIASQEHCLISRMSGSGASCFGLFKDIDNAKQSAKAIKAENPDWWIKTGWLNRPERY